MRASLKKTIAINEIGEQNVVHESQGTKVIEGFIAIGAPQITSIISDITARITGLTSADVLIKVAPVALQDLIGSLGDEFKYENVKYINIETDLSCSRGDLEAIDLNTLVKNWQYPNIKSISLYAFDENGQEVLRSSNFE